MSSKVEKTSQKKSEESTLYVININHQEFHLADLGKRYLAQFYDGLVHIVIIILFAFLSSVAGTMSNTILWIGFILAILYLLFADGMPNGQSIGKILVGTKTINSKTGRPSTYLQSLVRNLTYILSFIDYFFIFSGKRQRLGDLLASTYVVYCYDEPLSFIQKFFTKRREKREEEYKRQQSLNGKDIILSWTKTLVNAIVVVMIVNGILIASFKVPTGSMESTVIAVDFVFVNRF
ncbi:MAG TPA: RDD family protein, partial [Candidatus Kapabacteria bacterium]|nr:RDD family protein [Candidatus Kapabacteria bacterium]